LVVFAREEKKTDDDEVRCTNIFHVRRRDYIYEQIYLKKKKKQEI
jgi:hypothetical protein